MADVQPHGATASPKKLNIVWHGAFAFFLREGGVNVLTPKVGAHAHYAGTWEIGGLHQLRDGARFVLRGVKTSARVARFDPKYNIIVDSPPVAGVDKLVQSTWILPRPTEIFTLQRITMQAANFTGTIPREVHIPHEFGAVQVLTFDLDGSVPFVEGLPEWVPETGETVNLHVFAEEVNEWTTKSVLQHPTDEFQNLIRLTQLGQGPLPAFDYTPGEIPLVEPNPHLPDGVRRIELVSLAANGLLDENDPDVKTARSGVDSGGTTGHPCVGIIGGGG
ncbi:MAG: hypothetical protein ABSF54_19120 [Bryobacteraceae bacterium]